MSHAPTLSVRAAQEREGGCGGRNPIEKAFARVKQLLQDNAEQASYDPLTVLNNAFASIGPALGMAYTQNMLRVLESC